MTSDRDPLRHAPSDEAGWVALFAAGDLPVLAETAAALEDWRAHEDAADAHTVAASLDHDPLMTLKLFAHLARVNAGSSAQRLGGDVETLTGALVMLGIGPFFRAFGPQPVAERQLAADPEALSGFRAVLARSHRAAAFAMGFAAHRLDHDAEVLHGAALLHDVAELLLWLRAPAVARELRRRREAEPWRRSAELQSALMNAELDAVQVRLMRAWQLPPLWVRCLDPRQAQDPQVRTVTLATRVARHSAQGWGDPALPDDVREIGELLQLAEDPTRRLLLDIDAAA